MIKKEDIIYLKHISDSIEDIENSVKELSKKEFKENKGMLKMLPLGELR